jgi:predicted adenine nucleotide alpha hydrolase (AANH) superfamily ATPase
MRSGVDFAATTTANTKTNTNNAEHIKKRSYNTNVASTDEYKIRLTKGANTARKIIQLIEKGTDIDAETKMLTAVAGMSLDADAERKAEAGIASALSNTQQVLGGISVDDICFLLWWKRLTSNSQLLHN